MTPLWYVAQASNMMKIKDPELLKLAKVGACIDTPLEKKSQFTIMSWDEEGNINSVAYYAPGAETPNRILNLSPSIYPGHWREVFDLCEFYSVNMEEYQEKERIRQIVKDFEEKAKIHGQNQQAVALGDIGERHAYESGKALKMAREELYFELGV